MTRYTPYYCEENAWFAVVEGELGSPHALFIFSEGSGVAVWSQVASDRPDGLTLWDYHVVALGQQNGHWRVLDPDCSAGRSLSLKEWAEASFPFAGALPADVEPRFRAVPRETLIAEFHTDRSHMIADDGSWLAPPPPWEPLSDRSNLSDFLKLDGAIDLRALLGAFSDG